MQADFIKKIVIPTLCNLSFDLRYSHKHTLLGDFASSFNEVLDMLNHIQYFIHRYVEVK